MPVNNHFRHQIYSPSAPTASYELLVPSKLTDVDSQQFTAQLREAGQLYCAAKVSKIYLIHGTLAGTDALGWIGEIERAVPRVAIRLRRHHKQMVDRLVGDHGNYARGFRQTFEEGIRQEHQRGIPVRRFQWSSQNHHTARAEAAVLLVDELLRRNFPPDSRILLWGHSHGGNVLALVTNLLGCDVELRNDFFAATAPYVAGLPAGEKTQSAWERVRTRLMTPGNPLAHVKLDIVNFGTPIRYGWDTGTCEHLMHVVHHRVHAGLPSYQAAFPRTLEQVRQVVHGAYGDYIQQIGIAGTNMLPPVTNWPAWRTEWRLGALLQPSYRRRNLMRHLRMGVRTAHEGTTLLVDYSSADPQMASEMSGHAIYTYLNWLPYHALEIARRFYGGR